MKPSKENDDLVKNPRPHWQKIFHIDKFEKQDRDATFHNITTNGVDVSVIMKRKIRVIPPRVTQLVPVRPDATRLVGVDPGFRKSIVAVAWANRTLNLNGRISFEYEPYANQPDPKPIAINSKEWHHSTGARDRKNKLENHTWLFEMNMTENRKALEAAQGMISSKSPNYALFTEFMLLWFKRKCDVYMTDKIARLNFDKYNRTATACSNLAKRICPEGECTFVFFGAAKTSPNAPIKGYVRAPNEKLIEAMRSLGPNRCQIFMTDEFNTTQACSHCFRRARPTKQTGHRWQLCRVCHVSMDRDKVAGRNMIITGLQQHFGFDAPAIFTRGHPYVSFLSPKLSCY